MPPQDDRDRSRADTIKPIVLIVDDDPDDRAITLRVLSKQRIDVTCVEVNSGAAALTYLKATKELPAITLMDLKMPGMSGIETLQHIRSDQRLASATVVIVTNSSLESDRAAAIAAGADAFIQKDIVLDRYASDIAAQLERWCAK